MTKSEKPTTVQFGRRLASWRHQCRLTQQELADKLGYDLSYITKIERGARPPTRAFVARLSLVSGKSEESFWARASAEVGRPALPHPQDRLIGREDDIERIVSLLAGPARCVSLVGAPGIGKTRLAMEAAQRLDRVLADGSWWVSLADLVEEGAVATRIRRAMAVGDDPAVDAIESVLARRGSEEALIVLDNFEQVIGARPVVTRLIEGSAGLRILVTTREALTVLSEHVVRIDRLPFPQPQTNPAFESIRASAAVQLFTTRATMARPSFRLTTSNSSAVLRSCAYLDGVPLAIVLTAGGITTLDAGEIAASLENGLATGRTELRDLDPHHLTLESAIDRSWSRLDAAERELLGLLTVFAGGFTATAGACVAGWHDDVVRPMLRSLHRKSLIEAQPEAPSGPRFDLLATIRTFACDRLKATARKEERRRAHTRYFVDVAAKLSNQVLGTDQVFAVKVFTADFENLRLAFEYSLQEAPDDALAMAGHLWRLFVIGDIPTGQRWLEAALQACSRPDASRARALAASGALGWLTGHPVVAAVRLGEADELASALGLDDIRALVLVNEGALAEQQQRLDDADRSFARAMDLSKRLGDKRGQAVALNGLGMVLRRRGSISQAWPLWIEAAALFREVGDHANEAIALGNQAWAAEAEGFLDEADALSRHCRRIQIMLGDARGLAATTSAQARIAYRRGQLVEARASHLEALRGFYRLGDLPWQASTLGGLAAVLVALHQEEQAVRLLGVAEQLWEQIAAPPREEDAALLAVVRKACAKSLAGGRYRRGLISGRLLGVSDAINVVVDNAGR